jgi:ribosomal protein S18 acetylase RimI-like enzyme
VISYDWRGEFTNDAVNALHAEGFGHPVPDLDWQTRLHRHSLGWVCATEADGALAGFVNVAWDGGVHAFILDTVVAARLRHCGVGGELIAVATNHARAAGCAWLHVDFEDHLAAFYLERCGFRATRAGLFDLRAQSSEPLST